MLFPCSKSCVQCYKYSPDGDITSMSALSYAIGGQYVTPLIDDIFKSVVNFE